MIDETCALAAVVAEAPTKLEGAWRVKEQSLNAMRDPPDPSQKRDGMPGSRSGAATPASLGLGEYQGEGYFDLHEKGAATPGSVCSEALSMETPVTSYATAIAFTALQYLPIPLLVLSSYKTVVLANEAMGRLLGLDLTTLVDDGDKGPTTVLSATDLLRGKSMGQLGIDVLQGGSPIWVTWEVIAEGLLFPWTH